MDAKIKSAVVGLSALEKLAVAGLLGSYPGIEVSTFDSFDSFSRFSEKADFTVVKSLIFIENIDYFLPRKLKTIIVSDGIREKDSQLKIIYRDTDASEISDLIGEVVSECRKMDSGGELSLREKEVLKEIAEGKTNKEIADRLCISVNTVITHRKNISAKLGIRSVSGLSLYAAMNGIL